MTSLSIKDPNPEGNPGVLLLHGLGATSTSWQLQFQELIDAGFRPLAPDAPGFGESIYDGRGWSLYRISALLAEYLSEIESGPVHIVGLSMGGVIAQQFACDFPHLVRKLVLVSTFAVLRPESLSGWLYFIRRLLALSFLGVPAQARIVARRVFPEPSQEFLRQYLITTISQSDGRAYRAAIRSLGLFDSRRWLRTLRTPTLVISGAEDTTVSPLKQKILADEIHNAKHVYIQHAGHAVNIDQTSEFNNILLEFLT